MIPSRPETIERLRNIERMAGEIEAKQRAYGPLISGLLLRMTTAYAKAGRPLGGFSIHLCIEDWPKQYTAGIDRALGIDITWFRRVYRDPRAQYRNDMRLANYHHGKRVDRAIIEELNHT